MAPITLSGLIAAHPLIFKGKIPQVPSHLPPGWGRLVDELCTQIEATLSPIELKKLRVVQIKEKFGTLRFYYEGVAAERREGMRSLVSYACKRSAEICDTCGAPAQLKADGWWRTLCEPCDADRRKLYRADVDSF